MSCRFGGARPCLPIHIALKLRREIRNGEGNRKKYGVPDVKMLERKKRWKGLNDFSNRSGLLMQNVQIWVGLS